MLNVDSARSDNKTQKSLERLERLSDTALGLSAKFWLSNLRVKHLSKFVHKEEGRKRKRRKVVDELRASRPSETLFTSLSKIEDSRHCIEQRAGEGAVAARKSGQGSGTS